MSELTLTIMRLALLVALWAFVFSIVGVLRSDLYGTRVTSRSSGRRPAAATAPPRDGGATAPAAPSRRQGRQRGRDPFLVVTSGPLTGTALPLRAAGTLIGRSAESALVVDDDYASGRHARLYQDGNEWYVEDLDSTNGTFVGHQRISGPTRVDAGSVIRVGRTVLELRK